MMHMQDTIGSGFGFSLLWAVHALSVIVFFSGVLFLLVWAIKTFPLNTLRAWALGLIAVGAVLCLLTIAAVGKPWTSGFGAKCGPSTMMGGMMMRGTDDDDRRMGMMGGNMGMMSNMGMMLEGLEGDEFDEAFIRMMIPHHEGAIDMAEEALEASAHEEVKQLARDIISAQQREIDMMKGWQREWGYE